MTINTQSTEVLLQVSFGRGIQYLSTPPDNPDRERLSQLGERLCVAALECHLVSVM
jgi:hypothetical protein